MRVGTSIAFIYYLTLGLLVTASVSRPAPLRRLRRDASTVISEGTNNEGENHDPLDVPKAATVESIPVGDDGDEVAVYFNKRDAAQAEKARSVYIMIHGKMRNGNDYWEMMNNALQSAVDDDYLGVDENAYIVAPQFFSTVYNEGQYTDTQLAFGDVNGWQAGDIATHPEGTMMTSIDALDAIVATFADKSTYPNIANITLVGHGGGGQLITRYAAVGSMPEGVYVRYIVGDASTHAYFTKDRPVTYEVDGLGCEYWNTWRYGFDDFPGTASGKKTAKQYFTDYVNRDVIFLVANDDTKEGGDQQCPALMQGGVARRDRNLAWWTYINKLARTVEPVDMLGVANFSDLPDWSSAVNGLGVIAPRLVVVENADHNAKVVFASDVGRAALFNARDIPAGWRPDGYEQTLHLAMLQNSASVSAEHYSATVTASESSATSPQAQAASTPTLVDESSAALPSRLLHVDLWKVFGLAWLLNF